MLVALSIVIRFAGTTRSREISRRLGAWCQGIAAYVFLRSAIKRLNELDDRALRDIGLERSQIEAAVYGFVTLRNRGRV